MAGDSVGGNMATIMTLMSKYRKGPFIQKQLLYYPRDSKGGAGCGTLFYIGADDVWDARRAVEIALEQLPRQFGEVYVNEAGHLSFSYTARAGKTCCCMEKDCRFWH